jgi:hypothetical protein
MFAGRRLLPLGEREDILRQCRTKIPCLKEGAGYPFEKEKGLLW